MSFFLPIALAFGGMTVEVPGDHPNLASALSNTVAGDAIHLGEGTWTAPAGEDIDVAIVGMGPGTILQANGQGAVLEAPAGADVTLSALTLDGEGTAPVSCDGGRVVLEDVVLVGGGDLVGAGGGAIFAQDCSLWLERVQVAPATADGSGGQLYARDSDVTIIDSTFSGGAATGDGGAVWARGGSIALISTTIADASAVAGAGLFLRDTTAVLEDTTITTGVATAEGGALRAVDATVTIYRGRFDEGSAQQGGAISTLRSDLTVWNASFADDLASEDGGAVACTDGICAVLDSIFERNTATGNGGAVHVQSEGASVLGNLMCENQADDGGGIFVADVGAQAAANVYIRNTASRGGAVATSGATATLDHGTYVDNGATTRGAAVDADNGTVDLTNSLVVQHTVLPALDGTVAAMVTGYDWFWNNAGGDASFALDPTDTTGVDPIVANLYAPACDRDDVAPLPGSPLIDAGNGPLEPDGTPPDIGATGGPGALRDLDDDDVPDSLDCDPLDPAVGEPELMWPDGDDDGYGQITTPTFECEAPGLVPRGGDCDDGNPDVSPGLPELAGNGIDDDCDGLVDEDDAVPPTYTWYTDGDGDGFGDPKAFVEAAEQPKGTADNADDCDDANPDVNPAAQEACTGEDDDCDGLVDDEDPNRTGGSDFWADADGDGFGDPNGIQVACEAPADAVDNADDCDDLVAAVNPNATEVCNGIDDDCDGLTDGDDPDVTPLDAYVDADGDGFGDELLPVVDACDTGLPVAAGAGDCDDSDASVHPEADEVWYDGVDQDCDGRDDDQDGDGYDLAEDCDDTNRARNPSVLDIPDDGIDQDCDGVDAEFSYRAGGCNCATEDASSTTAGWGWGPLTRRR